MNLQSISAYEFRPKINTLFGDNWFLLSAGQFAKQQFNCMTISWGSMGVMWQKPFVQVVVRPSRFTHEFMESNSDFTLCAFPEQYKKALQLLGSKSGREGDKIKESGLTPCKSTLVSAPSYVEANLVIECKKIYTDVFRPQNFLDPSIEAQYPIGDYHQVYFGEILTLRGDRSVYS